MHPIEAYEDPDTRAKFYITHSDKNFTTGNTILQPQTELPAHSRPGAVENLMQAAGTSVVKLLDKDGNVLKEHTLAPGNSLSISEGQPHIHANPTTEPAATLFKAVGDTTAAVEGMRQNLTRL